MAVKYQCPKCGRRYIEWGAEKLNFLCPCADGAGLIRVGSPEDKAAKKPSLKRAVRRAAPARRAASVDEEEEVLEVEDVDVPDVEEEEEEIEDEVEVEVEVVEEVLEDDIDEEETDDLVDDDDEDEEVEVVEDLDFSDISSSLPAKPDHDEEEDWTS